MYAEHYDEYKKAPQRRLVIVTQDRGIADGTHRFKSAVHVGDKPNEMGFAQTPPITTGSGQNHYHAMARLCEAMARAHPYVKEHGDRYYI